MYVHYFDHVVTVCIYSKVNGNYINVIVILF